MHPSARKLSRPMYAVFATLVAALAWLCAGEAAASPAAERIADTIVSARQEKHAFDVPRATAVVRLSAAIGRDAGKVPSAPEHSGIEAGWDVVLCDVSGEQTATSIDARVECVMPGCRARAPPRG